MMAHDIPFEAPSRGNPPGVSCRVVPRTACDATLNAVYRNWRENWFALFSEINRPEHLCSDGFNMQDHHLCVFDEKACIASVGIRKLEHRRDADWDDSALQFVGAEWIEGLRSGGHDLILLSGLSVAAAHRRIPSSLPVPLLLVSFACSYLLHAKSRYSMAIARNEVGMSRIMYRHGAERLKADVEFHGKTCDVVLIDRAKIDPFPLRRYAETFSACVTSVDFSVAA